MLSVTPVLCELSHCFQCTFKNRSYNVGPKWNPCVTAIHFSPVPTVLLSQRRCANCFLISISCQIKPVLRCLRGVCLFLCHTTALLRCAKLLHSCAVPQVGRCGWNGFTQRVEPHMVLRNPRTSVSVIPLRLHAPLPLQVLLSQLLLYVWELLSSVI